MNRASYCTGLAAIFVLTTAVLSAAESKLKPKPKPKVETLSGKVVRVIDGDTLMLLVGKARRKIRLAGIDAPEEKQPFGAEAKKALSKKLFGKTVQVRVTSKDRDRTVLGVVRLEGQCVNVDLVRGGYAWHDVDANNSRTLAKVEKQARAKKQGLWAETDPMPPWEWRRIEEAKQDSNATKSRSASTDKQTHWLNTRSNIRHNSRCKYYKQTKQGRMCGPNEGKACKMCGG
jgi:endonuclease YncB( thermonuclease family)